MLDLLVIDLELKNAILREWREPRPAIVVAASRDRKFEEHHFWHAATSSGGGWFDSTGRYDIIDSNAAGLSWVGIVPFLPDGAVSLVIGSGLKPDSIRLFAQNFKSTEGITHRQHRERDVQLPPRRPPFMRA